MVKPKWIKITLKKSSESALTTYELFDYKQRQYNIKSEKDKVIPKCLSVVCMQHATRSWEVRNHCSSLYSIWQKWKTMNYCHFSITSKINEQELPLPNSHESKEMWIVLLCLPGGSVLPAPVLVRGGEYRWQTPAGWAAPNAGASSRAGSGQSAAPDHRPAGQDPGQCGAAGDGVPVGGLLLQPGAPPRRHVQGLRHGQKLLSVQQGHRLCANRHSR